MDIAEHQILIAAARDDAYGRGYRDGITVRDEALERIRQHAKDGMAGADLDAQIARYIDGNGKAKQQHDVQAKIAHKKYDQYTGAIECAREEKKIWG